MAQGALGVLYLLQVLGIWYLLLLSNGQKKKSRLCCWRVSSGTDYKSNLRARGLQVAKQNPRTMGALYIGRGAAVTHGLGWALLGADSHKEK